jgi:putative membrane protein
MRAHNEKALSTGRYAMNSAICNHFLRWLAAGMLAIFMALHAHAATLTDEEIVGIVAVANVNEINASKLAASNAYQDKVKAFAEQMAKDHRQMDQQMGQLAVKLKLNPVPTEASEALKADGSEIMETLKIAPKGPIFDKEYMSSQVMAHEKVLGIVNNELIPNAKNEQLRNLLQQSSRKIESHLERARQLHEEITANI